MDTDMDVSSVSQREAVETRAGIVEDMQTLDAELAQLRDALSQRTTQLQLIEAQRDRETRQLREMALLAGDLEARLESERAVKRSLIAQLTGLRGLFNDLVTPLNATGHALNAAAAQEAHLDTILADGAILRAQLEAALAQQLHQQRHSLAGLQQQVAADKALNAQQLHAAKARYESCQRELPLQELADTDARLREEAALKTRELAETNERVAGIDGAIANLREQLRHKERCKAELETEAETGTSSFESAQGELKLSLQEQEARLQRAHSDNLLLAKQRDEQRAYNASLAARIEALSANNDAAAAESERLKAAIHNQQEHAKQSAITAKAELSALTARRHSKQAACSALLQRKAEHSQLTAAFNAKTALLQAQTAVEEELRLNDELAQSEATQRLEAQLKRVLEDGLERDKLRADLAALLSTMEGLCSNGNGSAPSTSDLVAADARLDALQAELSRVMGGDTKGALRRKERQITLNCDVVRQEIKELEGDVGRLEAQLQRKEPEDTASVSSTEGVSLKRLTEMRRSRLARKKH